MRISVHAGAYGGVDALEIMASGKRIRVFLDGVEQAGVISADDELGELERHVLDADGKAQVDPDDIGRVWVETVRGKVEIRIEDGD